MIVWLEQMRRSMPSCIPSFHGSHVLWSALRFTLRGRPVGLGALFDRCGWSLVGGEELQLGGLETSEALGKRPSPSSSSILHNNANSSAIMIERVNK